MSGRSVIEGRLRFYALYVAFAIPLVTTQNLWAAGLSDWLLIGLGFTYGCVDALVAKRLARHWGWLR